MDEMTRRMADSSFLKLLETVKELKAPKPCRLLRVANDTQKATGGHVKILNFSTPDHNLRHTWID